MRQSQHHQAARQERSVILPVASPEEWLETQHQVLSRHTRQAQVERYLALVAQFGQPVTQLLGHLKEWKM
jgi:hypothetical protein